MSDLTDYGERQVANWVFKGTAPASNTPHVALFTAAPSETGGGTECADANYVRQALSAKCTALTNQTNGLITNDLASIEYPAMAASQTIVAVGIMDASTGGNMIAQKAITSTTVGIGQVFRFNTSQLSLTVA